jgi:hypothetical protein
LGFLSRCQICCTTLTPAVISCWPLPHLLYYNSARIYPHSHSVQVYGHHTQSRFTIIAFI